MKTKSQASKYFCTICKIIGSLDEIRKHQFNEHYDLVLALCKNDPKKVKGLMKEFCYEKE